MTAIATEWHGGDVFLADKSGFRVEPVVTNLILEEEASPYAGGPVSLLSLPPGMGDEQLCCALVSGDSGSVDVQLIVPHTSHKILSG